MINLFDIGVIGIILISGLIAFPRGLVKEVFALANWVIAGFVGFIGAKKYGYIATQYITPEELAMGVMGLGIGVVVFIIMSILTTYISNLLLSSSLGIIDRILGLAFGILRGVLIVVPIYWLIREYWPEEAAPPMLVAQFTKPYLEMGRDWFTQQIPVIEQWIKDFNMPDAV